MSLQLGQSRHRHTPPSAVPAHGAAACSPCAPFAPQRGESDNRTHSRLCRMFMLSMLVDILHSLSRRLGRSQHTPPSTPQSGCLIFLRSVRAATRRIECTLYAFVYIRLATGLYSLYCLLFVTTRHSQHTPPPSCRCRADACSSCFLRSFRAATPRIEHPLAFVYCHCWSIFYAVCHDDSGTDSTRRRPTERLLDLLALRSRCNAAN